MSERAWNWKGGGREGWNWVLKERDRLANYSAILNVSFFSSRLTATPGDMVVMAEISAALTNSRDGLTSPCVDPSFVSNSIYLLAFSNQDFHRPKV